MGHSCIVDDLNFGAPSKFIDRDVVFTTEEVCILFVHFTIIDIRDASLHGFSRKAMFNRCQKFQIYACTDDMVTCNQKYIYLASVASKAWREVYESRQHSVLLYMMDSYRRCYLVSTLSMMHSSDR